MKTMLKKQLKQLPEDQQEKVLSAFEKNPDFFKEMAEKIHAKVKEGKDQQSAAMEVMMENQGELGELLK